MSNYLVQHALKNVWCSPHQDRQAVLEMKKITPIGGIKNSMDLMWDRINMPEAGSQFHVYQIGSNFPPQLNLPKKINVWMRISDLCIQQRQVVDVFLKDGREYPRSTTWIARTFDRNYIVATKINTLIDNLDDQNLLIRFYSNAYFDSPRSTDAEKIDVQGGTMTSTAVIADLTTKYNAAKVKPGFVYAFHNGEYVVDFSTVNVKIGDAVEFVHDSSVYRVIDFPIANLQSFQSTLDSVRKYLIHPNKADDEPTIQYHDDIDIFLYKKDTTNRIKGIYYHRYQETAVRMVTHADYSIPVPTLQGFVTAHPYWGNSTDLVVRVQMRKAGYERPLVFEHHRIHELYKLDDTSIVRGMLGIDSTVDEWKAASLEDDSYAEIMQAKWSEVTLPLVLDAYGYNASAKLVGDTPQKLTILNGERFVVLPVGLMTNSTLYEFDADGLLLGWYLHYSGGRHYARNPTATVIEGVSGLGSKNLDLVIGNDPVTLSTNNGYRLYVSPKYARVVTNEWVEIADTDTTHVNVIDGKVYWLHDTRYWQGAVKQDDRFLAYSLSIPTSYDLYRFSPTYTDINGVILYIPPGRVDLWLNKRRLIRDLDFYVDYPQIVIVNKDYLSDDDDQVLDVRGVGFCLSDMSFEPSKQTGFVENGLLSYNGQFDLRDDKVVQITVDGRVVTREDVNFPEDGYGVGVSSVYEGRPYEVSDVAVPIRGVVDYDTYTLRARSQELDTRVSNYLTTKLPEHIFTTLPDILQKYRVFSPFLNRMIGDILSGVLVVPSTVMTDRQVLLSLADYRYLLTYDPCLRDIDDNHVVIHPVSGWDIITVKQVEYSYLERVITLLLNDRVDLTHFLKIEG